MLSLVQVSTVRLETFIIITDPNKLSITPDNTLLLLHVSTVRLEILIIHRSWLSIGGLLQIKRCYYTCIITGLYCETIDTLFSQIPTKY